MNLINIKVVFILQKEGAEDIGADCEMLSSKWSCVLEQYSYI